MSDFFIKDLILKMNGINEEIQQSLAMKVRSLLLLIYSSTNSNVLAKGLTLLLNDSVYPMIASMIFYYRCFYSNVSPGEGFTGVIVKRKKNLVYYFMAISVQKIIYSTIDSFYQRIKEKMIAQGGAVQLRILKYIEIVTPSLSTLGEIQITYFLLSHKSYMNIFQKLFHIEFIYDKKNRVYPSWMKLIGYCSLLRLTFKGISTLKQLYITYKTDRKEIIAKNKALRLILSKKKIANDQCVLCMEKFKDISVTQCGHLFCWKCITQYLESNNECPQCRKRTSPNQVIYIQNID